MNRTALDRAVKEHGAWLPERVFLSLVPEGLRRGSAEDMADELDVLTFESVTGTMYRAEDLKAALSD